MSNKLTEVKILLNDRLNQSDDLASAASLAKTLNLKLKGVFIEEENLIHAAELSISSEISRWSAKEKEMNSDSVKQLFRIHANRQQKDFQRIAEQENVEYEFDVVRGERNSWVVDDVKRKTLLFVTRQNVIRNNCNNLAYSFLNKSKATINAAQYPVKVVFNSSSTSMLALEVAIKIAQDNHRTLTVLIDTDTFEDEFIFREKINSYLETQRKIEVCAELINTQNKEKQLTQDLFTLIYPVDSSKTQFLQKLLQALDRPLVLLR